MARFKRDLVVKCQALNVFSCRGSSVQQFHRASSFRAKIYKVTGLLLHPFKCSIIKCPLKLHSMLLLPNTHGSVPVYQVLMYEMQLVNF